MAAVEVYGPLQQNKLTSVVNAPDWEFRKSNRWVNRYFKEFRPKWDERSNTLTRQINTHPDESYKLFEYATPGDKFKLIELTSCFGTGSENSEVASSLLAAAIQQYSNPDGLSINEQYEFFYDRGLHMETKPVILLEGLDIFFNSLREDQFHEDKMIALEMRRNKELPQIRPAYETHFMRHAINAAITMHRENKGADMEMFRLHFETNKDMYEHFGLIYDETEKRARAFYDPLPEPKKSE
jgi:hypothetical protein